MSEVAIIYKGNDTVLELSDLTNETTGDNINDATVTITLTDSDGVSVSGDVWPKIMTHVTNSNGVYRVTLLDTLVLTNNARYIAKISANGGAGLQGYWEKDLICKVRK